MLTLRFLAVRDVSSAASNRGERDTYWSIQIEGGRRTCFVDMRNSLPELTEKNEKQQQQPHAQVRELT